MERDPPRLGARGHVGAGARAHGAAADAPVLVVTGPRGRPRGMLTRGARGGRRHGGRRAPVRVAATARLGRRPAPRGGGDAGRGDAPPPLRGRRGGDARHPHLRRRDRRLAERAPAPMRPLLAALHPLRGAAVILAALRRRGLGLGVGDRPGAACPTRRTSPISGRSTWRWCSGPGGWRSSSGCRRGAVLSRPAVPGGRGPAAAGLQPRHDDPDAGGAGAVDVGPRDRHAAGGVRPLRRDAAAAGAQHACRALGRRPRPLSTPRAGWG